MVGLLRSLSSVFFFQTLDRNLSYTTDIAMLRYTLCRWGLLCSLLAGVRGAEIDCNARTAVSSCSSVYDETTCNGAYASNTPCYWKGGDDDECRVSANTCIFPPPAPPTMFGSGAQGVDVVDALSCGGSECFSADNHILTTVTAKQLADVGSSQSCVNDNTGWCHNDGLSADLRANVYDYLGGQNVLDHFGGEGAMKYQQYMAVVHAVKVYTGVLTATNKCGSDADLGNGDGIEPCIDDISEVHDNEGNSPADVCAIHSDGGAELLQSSKSRCIQAGFRSESLSFIPFTDVVTTSVDDPGSNTVHPPSGLDIHASKSVVGMNSARISAGSLQLLKNELHCKSKSGTNDPITQSSATCAGELQCASAAPWQASVTGHKCSKYVGIGERFKRAADAGIPPPKFRTVPGYFDLVHNTDCDPGRYDSPRNVIYGFDDTTTGSYTDDTGVVHPHDGFKCLFDRNDIDETASSPTPLTVRLEHDQGSDPVNLHDVLWYAPALYVDADDANYAWVVRTTLISHVDMLFNNLHDTAAQNDFRVAENSFNLGYYVDEMASSPAFATNGFVDTAANDGATEGYFGFYSRACLDATSVFGYTPNVDIDVQPVKCLRQSVKPFLFHIRKSSIGTSQFIQVSSIAAASRTVLQIGNVECHHIPSGGIDHAFLSVDVSVHGFDQAFNDFHIQKVTLVYNDGAGRLRLTPGLLGGTSACSINAYPGLPCSTDSAEKDGEFSATSSLRVAVGGAESSCLDHGFVVLDTGACFDAIQTATQSPDMSIEIEYAMEMVESSGVVTVFHHAINCDNLFCASVQTAEVVDRLQTCLDTIADTPPDMSITSSVQLYSQSMSVISRMDNSQFQISPSNPVCPLMGVSGVVLNRCPTLFNEQCNPFDGTSVRSFQQVQIGCDAVHYDHLHMNAYETHQENPNDPVSRSSHVAAVSNTEAHIVTGSGLGYAFLGSVSAPSYAPSKTLSLRQQLIFPVGAILTYTTGGTTVPLNLFGTIKNGAWQMTADFWRYSLGMPPDVYPTVKNALETRATTLIQNSGNVLTDTQPGVHIDSDSHDEYKATQNCEIHGLHRHTFSTMQDSTDMCATADADYTCGLTMDPALIVVGDPAHSHADQCGHGAALTIAFNHQPYLYTDAGQNIDASDISGLCFPEQDRATFKSGAGTDCSFSGTSCSRDTSFRGCALWPMDDDNLLQGSDYSGNQAESFFEVFKGLTRNQRVTMASAVGVTINDAYLAQSDAVETTWTLQVQYAHVGNLEDFGQGTDNNRRQLQVTTETVNQTLTIAQRLSGNASGKQHRKLQDESNTSAQTVVSTASHAARPCIDSSASVVDGLFQSACVCTGTSESRECVTFYESQRDTDDKTIFSIETSASASLLIVAIVGCIGIAVLASVRKTEEKIKAELRGYREALLDKDSSA